MTRPSTSRVWDTPRWRREGPGPAPASDPAAIAEGPMAG